MLMKSVSSVNIIRRDWKADMVINHVLLVGLDSSYIDEDEDGTSWKCSRIKMMMMMVVMMFVRFLACNKTIDS